MLMAASDFPRAAWAGGARTGLRPRGIVARRASPLRGRAGTVAGRGGAARRAALVGRTSRAGCCSALQRSLPSAAPARDDREANEIMAS